VKKAKSGQGLVEFALVLPVLLLLIIGVLDFGAAFFVKVQLENSAREGANYMVYHATDTSPAPNPFTGAKDAAHIEGENSGVLIPSSNIDVYCLVGATKYTASCPSGSTVVVSVPYTMPLAVDIFLGGPLHLTGDARMMVP
jgi:Flp pilus assembly protein TadG